jgi:hypothetical protein
MAKEGGSVDPPPAKEDVAVDPKTQSNMASTRKSALALMITRFIRCYLSAHPFPSPPPPKQLRYGDTDGMTIEIVQDG